MNDDSHALPSSSLTFTSPRYEVKIPLPAHWLADVEAWIRLHPAQWRVTYPPRQVNNIYFDTPHYDGLNANLGGYDDRDKLRLRWYGTDITRIVGANLERKHKHGMVGWKSICPVAGVFDLNGTPWRTFSHMLRSAVAPQIRQWLDVFAVPALINHYRRVYYATPDGMVRLTVDTALHAYDQCAVACPNLTRRTHVDTLIVVELKAATDDASFRQLADALARFPASVDRFSKYVQGMMA